MQVFNNVIPRTLVPLQDALRAAGDKKSQGYANIGRGLFPKPVKAGKTSLIPSDELAAIIDARVAGFTEDQTRELVAKLEAARTRPVVQIIRAAE